MAFQNTGAVALDYFPCRYGTCKLVFRGPKRRLDGAYCTVLGGNETYGRFLERPYPVLVEEQTGLRMVNFACMNAGVDVYLNDPGIIELCAAAKVTVVQVMGAQNMSNRFYAVHPRRNDRFLRASSLLKAMYRDIDFTEFNFTRHMLHTLHNRSPERFEVVADELKAAWVTRMQSLLRRVSGKSVLLWIGDNAPPEASVSDRLESEPLLIDRDMIAAVRAGASEYVETIISPGGQHAHGTEGMICTALDAAVASELPGPVVHAEVVRALAPVLQRLMG